MLPLEKVFLYKLSVKSYRAQARLWRMLNGFISEFIRIIVLTKNIEVGRYIDVYTVLNMHLKRSHKYNLFV